MPQSRRQGLDSALEAERQLKYQGTACIDLDILRFGRGRREELDRGHVEHLKKCFRDEGCQRLPARNHVPVLISQQQLADAIRDSGVSTQQLFAGQQKGYPSLEFGTGVRLECLHGRHRIEAGREFLLPTERWWTVDLYRPDLDHNLRSWLVEEYSHEQRPSDGEIYQRLRQYDTEKNLSSKLRWKCRLQGIRAKSLNTLYKHEDLTDAFDALLVIPGLWHGMKLSTIHKLFPLRCNEEIVHYLRHIKSAWSGLVRGSREAMSRIDTATVQALQMRAPRASTTDAKMLRSQLRAGEIFSAFNDHEREDIWSRLQMVEGVIPSLHTLFSDVGYLEHCVNCVKRLTALSPGQSLSRAMKGRFTGANQRHGRVKVQVTEGKFAYRRGTPEDQVDSGYRQIHAFAMRHWPDMPKEPETEDPQMKAPIRADKATLRHFADLAAELGFRSDQITDLQQYSGRGDPPAAYSQSNPALVTSGKGVHVKNRCGKQTTREFMEDRHCLFIDHLHDERQEQGSGITSFFVRKSVYLAFFGKPLETDSSTSAVETSPDPRPQGPGGSPQGYRQGGSPHPPIDNRSPSRQASEHLVEPYDGILTLYQQSDARRERGSGSNITKEEAAERAEGSMNSDSVYGLLEEEEELERERLEQERLELRRIEEGLEREDLQTRFAQGLQAQETAEREKQRALQLQRQEQERHEEEQRRQETRQRQRREEEVRVHGRTLRNFERTKRPNTQLDMESIAAGRELVIADQSYNPGHLRSPATDRSGEQYDRLEQERCEPERPGEGRREPESVEHEGREQERREQERQEQERAELRRIEGTLEREDLQERLAEALQAQENLELVKQRQQQLEKHEQERQREAGRRQQIREQRRREQEKTVKDDAERTRKRHTRNDMESVLANARGNQEGSSAQIDYHPQLGREPVVIEPSSKTAGDLQAGGRRERRERSEDDRLEREKPNQEKSEQERLQRKTFQERFARELEQQEKRVKDQQEQERQESDRREAVWRQQERRDQQRWEHERTIESEENLEPAKSHRDSPAETTRPRRRQVPTPPAQTPDAVWITFKIRERGAWRTTQSLHVHSSDPSEVERVAVKYMRKRVQIRVYDTDLNILTPQMCFHAAIARGWNMLLLIPGKEIDINETLEASVSRLLSESDLRVDTDIE